MEISIVYFSGTGNTRFISDKLKDKLEQYGKNSVETIPVEKAMTEQTALWDNKILGIGFPVYDLMPPEPILTFINTLQTQKTPGKSFVFSTYTSYPLDANTYIINALNKKGFYVNSQQTFKTPGAVTYFYANPSNPLIKKEACFAKGINLHIEQYAQSILENIKNPPPALQPKHHPLRKLHQARSRLLIGNLFYRNLRTNSSCTACGLCAKHCPESNLEVTGSRLIIKKPNNCLRCMRCIQLCPVDAINFTSSRRRGSYNQSTIEKLYTARLHCNEN